MHRVISRHLCYLLTQNTLSTKEVLVDRDDIELVWLGQAGFLVRGAGATLAIDPYLSDECAALYGLVRTSPAPVAIDELDADLILVSHRHEDHFDVPVVLAALARGATVVAPASVVARIEGRGFASDRLVTLEQGAGVEVADVAVSAVLARHEVSGFLTEDAVGFLIRIGGITIYHSGDTEYTRLIPEALAGPIDAALLCVNGTGGNMNALEAAAPRGAARRTPRGPHAISGCGSRKATERERPSIQRSSPGRTRPCGPGRPS